jgi:3-oxoacyl-[acyl-carrier protein] reductase
MAIDLNGKVALITGGGTGLGREIAHQLAAERMRLAISYSRSRAEAEETADSVRGLGVEAIPLQADLRDVAAPAALIADVERQFGRLDLLIHNAGTTRFIPFSDLDSVDEAAWEELLTVNTRSAFFLARAAAPVMRRQGGGQIITTSSVAGLSPAGSSLPYSVSKAALIHLTKCLAVALAPDIRVNSVAPGLLRTRWVAGFTEDRLQAMSQASALKKHTDVPDTAAAFVMLAKNSSVTGQVIVVDAGISLK